MKTAIKSRCAHDATPQTFIFLFKKVAVSDTLVSFAVVINVFLSFAKPSV